MTNVSETLLSPRYRLQDKLGQGGMGVVYRKPENVLQVQAYSFLQTRAVNIKNETFLKKMETLKEMEQITEAIGFVYSRSGFSTPALTILHEHQIAYNDDVDWLE